MEQYFSGTFSRRIWLVFLCQISFGEKQDNIYKRDAINGFFYLLQFP